MALIFHTRDRNTLLCRMHGAVKLLFLLLFSSLVSTGSGPFVIGCSALILLIAILDKLPPSLLFKQGFFFLVIALFILISEYMNTASPYLALIALLRFLSIVLSSLLLTDTTTPDEIARGVGGLLSPLLGSFAWRLASVTELTISMLPVITDSTEQILTARRARGERMLRHPIRSLTGLTVSILSLMLTKVEQYADALSARSYESSARRHVPPLTRADLFPLFTMVLIIGGFIWTREA